MKKVSQLLEATEKRGVLAFMRANPPTLGHSKVVDAAMKEPGDKRIYVSHTQDDKKNPLSADEKISYFHKMYPNHKHFFRKSSKEEPTIFHSAAKMHKEGVKHLTVIAGEDRVKEFHDKLHQYNGKFDTQGNGYHFKSITVKSAGARDPDADGVEGMSATKMRSAAIKGDKKTFYSGLHPNLTHDDAKDMMGKIRERLAPKNPREEYLQGTRFNEGDIVISESDGVSIEGQIVYKGSNYVTILAEDKTEHKCWIDTLKESTKEAKRDQIYKNDFIYKGYRTHNLTRELAEEFKHAAKDATDTYGLLSCIKCCDYIMSVDVNQVIENFDEVKIQLERAKRYTNRFSINIENKLEEVETYCAQHAVLEGINFVTTDRMMIAKLISSVSGVDPVGNDPTAIINRATIKLRLSQLTPPGWVIVGRMLNMATKAGIRWSRSAFSKPQQEMMELE